MANEYFVNADDLTAVADAIREKGDTSDALAFPDGFVGAIEAIQAGGDDLYAAIAEGTVTEINDDKITTFRANAFYGITSLKKATFTRATSMGYDTFRNCTALTEIHLPSFSNKISDRSFLECTNLETIDILNITGLGLYAFGGCRAITSIDLPNCTEFSSSAFQSCEKLQTVNLPKVGGIGAPWSNDLFKECVALERADLHNCEVMGSGIFYGCTSLVTLILRGEAVCTLDNVNSFTNTPLTGYGDIYEGHVYVPEALIPEYQAATNWATMYAAYPEIFQPIEGSEYE